MLRASAGAWVWTGQSLGASRLNNSPLRRVKIAAPFIFAISGSLAAVPPAHAEINVDGYLVDPAWNRLRIFETGSNSIVAEPPIDGRLTYGVAATPDGRSVYTANFGSNDLTVFDAAAKEKIGQITGFGSAPAAMAPSPDGRFVYVANLGTHDVAILDTRTRQIVGDPIPVGRYPQGIAVSPDGSSVYTSSIDYRTMSVIDTASRRVVATVQGLGDQGYNLAVTPDGRQVYVVNMADDTVSVVDTQARAVVGTIAVGKRPLGVAVSPDGKQAYVTNFESGTVTVIDTHTRTVAATIPVSDEKTLINVSLTPDGRRAYLTLLEGIAVLDTATNTIVERQRVQGSNSRNGPFLGPNVIVARGGAVAVDGNAQLAKLGFLNFINFNGGTLRAMADLSIGQTVSLLPGGGRFDTNGFAVTVLGAVQGEGGLSKDGAGILTLAGSSTYAGPTRVQGGKLMVGSDAHPGANIASVVTISSGATLGGTGTVGGIVARNGATVAPGGNAEGPGSGAGTLNVVGDVSFAADSAYLADIDPWGANDRIVAGGTATLAGTVHVHKAAGQYVPGMRYIILTADGGVRGRFDALAQNLPFVDLALNYDARDVYLDIVRNATPFSSVADTSNQAHAAAGVEALGRDNPLYHGIVGLDTAAARRTFDRLSGTVHASARTAFIDDSRFLRDAAWNRLRSALGTGEPFRLPAGDQAWDGHTQRLPGTGGKVFWAQSFGAWGHVNGNANAARLGYSSGGAFFGTDTALADNGRIGALAGYSSTGFHAGHQASSGHSDNIHLGLYGGTLWKAWSLRGGMGYTWHDVSARRSVALMGRNDNLKSRYNAAAAQIFGELGYLARAGAHALEPYFNMAYVNLHTSGFAESGGPEALRGRGDSSNTLFSTLGTHARTAFALGKVQASARGTLGWRHAYGTVTPTAALSFRGGNAYTVTGVPISRDAAVVEAGLDLAVKKHVTFSLAYSGQAGGGAQANSAQASLAWMF